VFRIRIHIGSAFDGRLDQDPDPGSLKRAKIKGETTAKGQIIRQKVLKTIQFVYKWLNVTLFSLKLNIYFLSITKFCFKRMTWIRIRFNQHSFSKLDPDPHSLKKLDPDPHKVNADLKHWLKKHSSEYFYVSGYRYRFLFTGRILQGPG
jgi:hypothetical protein